MALTQSIYKDDVVLSSYLDQLFQLYDTGHQGWIDLSEFADAQSEMAHQLGGSEGEVGTEELFKSIDKDSNGKISKEEFFDWQYMLFSATKKTKSRIRGEVSALVREMTSRKRSKRAAPKRGSAVATSRARRGSGSAPGNSSRASSPPGNSSIAGAAGKRGSATRRSASSTPRGRSTSPAPVTPRPSSTTPITRTSESREAPRVEVVELNPGSRTADEDPREFAWRNQTVIGAFLDPYIENTNLEGGSLANCLKEVAVALRGAADEGMIPAKAHSTVSAIANLFRKAHGDGVAAKSAYQSHMTSQATKWIKELRTQLQALSADEKPPDNMLVQEGGWRSDRGGHAILYVFEKTGANTYALTVVNTGAGVHQYHPSNAEAIMHGKMKYRTALRIPNIRDYRLLSPEFLLSLFRLKHQPHKQHNSAQLYMVILPWLLGSNCGGDCASAAMMEESRCGDLATIQRSGTCFFKCVAHTLKFLLQSCGVTPGDRKATMLAFRSHLLNRIEKDLPDALRLRTLSASEKLVVTIAAKQVARRALKEKSAGRIEDHSLERIREQVSSLQSLLSPPTMVAAEARHRHLETFPPDATWSPFVGFTPISDSFNVNEIVRADLGGPAVLVEPPAFVDLADIQELYTGSASASRGPGVSRIAHLLSVLRSLVVAADDIDKAGEIHGKRQVLALIEDLLVDSQYGAGAPMLLNHSDTESTLMTYEQRDELLGLWEMVSRHYLAAALSVPNGLGVFARRIVTYARLLEQLDRTVRSRASGAFTSPFFECMRNVNKPLWSPGTLPTSGSLSDRSVRPGVNFGALTAHLPFLSPACLRCRELVASYFETDAELRICGYESNNNEFWFKNIDDFPGISVVRFCATLLGNAKEAGLIGMDQMPDIQQIARPFRDFEINAAWAFDSGLDRACTDWKQCRDIFIRFHVLMGLSRPGDDGSDSPGCADGNVMYCKEAVLHYSPSFYDVIAGFPDVLQFKAGIGKDGKRPALISVAVPTSRCTPAAFGITSAGIWRRRDDVNEQDILVTDPLPDFGRSMTQRDAEEFFSILTVPSVRIPLLLRFLVPDRVGLLHDPHVQDVILAALFEPGPLNGRSSDDIKTAPCDPNLLGVSQGYLVNELLMAPAATLTPFMELLQAKTELGACDFDGPYVQPFLFVLRLSIFLQVFVLDVLRLARSKPQQRILEEFNTQMRRFNQAYARSRLMRWLQQAQIAADFAAAATLHAHLCLTSLPLETLELEDVQSIVSSSTLFRTWHREVPNGDETPRATVSLNADVVVLVSVCMHMHRLSVLQWLGTAKVRDDILNFTLMQALGQRSAKPPRLSWRPIERDIEATVHVVVESSHPYSVDDVGTFPIKMPSSKQVTIRFDERSVVMSWQSLKIERDGSVLKTISNSQREGLPGTGDELPLVVNGEKKLTLKFTDLMPAGGDETKRLRHWGYRVILEFPLEDSLLETFARSQRGIEKWACAEALVASGGDSSQAAHYIASERERLEEEQTRRAARASRLGRYESNYADAHHGAWPADMQWLQGAIFDVQSGALYFRRRGSPEPLPDELLSMADFQSVRDLLKFSELGQPNCIVQATQVLRQKKLQFTAFGKVFTAELWASIPSSGETGHIRRGARGAWEPGRGGDPAAANFPFLKDAKLHWRGIEWTELGNWQKALPERLSKSAALQALLSVPQPIEGEINPTPESWLQACGWPESLGDTRCYINAREKRCAVLRPFDGAWAELRILPSGHVTIYALEEVARSVFCRAVWTSDVRGDLFYCDPDASSRLRNYPSALACPAGDLLIPFCTRPSVRLTREHELHVPRRLLQGLLPHMMLRENPPAFDFWQSGEAITGEPRDKHSPWFSYLLHVDLPRSHADQATIWRQGADGERWLLVNVQVAAAHHLRALCQMLRTLEPLAYVLIWAAQVSGGSSELTVDNRLELRAIELPRLGLRFDPQRSEDGGYRLQSRAHEGFFLSPTALEEESFPYALPPENVVLKSRTGDAKVVAPIGPIRREDVYLEPFSRGVVLQREPRATRHWMSNFVTYEVPVLKMSLVCGSQLSALWLCTTRLLQRDYLGAAKMLTFCTPDHRFMRDELLVWQEATRLTSDCAPDAGAVRLRLMLLAEHWGGLNDSCVSKGALFAAWGEYLQKLTHVSPECRLTWHEEIVLCKALAGTRYEDKILHQLVENRGTLILKFPQVEKGRECSVDLTSGWCSGGAWWNDILAKANFGGVTRDKWQVDTVNCAIVTKASAAVSQEALIRDCQDEKLIKGPWVTLYAIFSGDLGSDSDFNIRQVALLALREYLCHNAPDRSGTSLEACVALSLAVLWRDTESGGPGAREYPAYSDMAATEVKVESGVKGIMSVDTEARAMWFLDFVTAALRSLKSNPWNPYNLDESIPSATVITDKLQIGPAHLPFELPRAPKDFSCSWRAILNDESSDEYRDVGFNKSQVVSAASGEPMQLAVANLFDIADHAPWTPPEWQAEAGEAPLPSLQTVLGINQVTMNRMVEDCRVYHEHMQTSKTRPQLSFLSRADLSMTPPKERTQDAIKALDCLLENLSQACEKCVLVAESSVSSVVASLRRHRTAVDALAQIAGTTASMNWSWALCTTLGQEDDVLKALGLQHSLDASSWQAVMCVLVRATLVQHVRRAQALGFRLQSALKALLGDAVSAEQLREVESAMESLASELLARRVSGKQNHAGEWGADPKLLVFEWIFGKGLLKPEQLEMVQAFADAAKKNNSKVTQMIMGGGKTHVISPLLQLHLCSQGGLVVQVVPENLLAQTIRVMRCELSQFLSLPVFCFNFSRNAERDIDFIKRMRWRLSVGISECAVLCSTGSSVKACLLTYVDILASARDNKLDELQARKAFEMQRILRYLRAATAVLDEIDLLLHPLKSEMNFPLGLLQEIDLTPERWELPLHLLQPFCFAEEALGGGSTTRSTKALLRVRKAIREGYQLMAMQQQPHALLLSREFYHETLLSPLREWLAEWLLLQPCLQSEERGQVISLLQNSTDPITGIPRGRARQLLVLGREWLFSMLPHCLQKVNRVQYGLLLDIDVERLRKRGQPSFGTRLDLAVPFVGKDTPSVVSEFSHPEVLIGLTILACAYSGLRPGDVRAAILQLKGFMINENVGAWHRRPSWRRYQRWLAQAELQLTGDEVGRSVSSMPPLHLTHPEGYMLQSLHKHLQNVPDCQSWYLSQLVFPRAMRIQHKKLSATASELGGEDLFSIRLGFSGTPATTLPLSLPAVDFAPGTEGRVFATMTALDVVSLRCVNKGWTVRSLLSLVASRGYHALIDTGALVTGMTNIEVASFLLDRGLAGLDGVVFLSRDDTEMVLLREARGAIPLAECSLAPHRRFTFYDNSHTTGIDIDQAYLSTAALTLGKDMTFRDAQQGAWRMRRLGTGQRLELLLVEELVGVIRSTLGSERVVPKGNDSQALRDVIAFLLANQFSGEVMAASQLAHHDLRNAWKHHAIKSLVENCKIWPIPDDLVQLPAETIAAISILSESISFLISSEVEESSKDAISKLEQEAENLQKDGTFGFSGRGGARRVINRTAEMLTEASRGGSSRPKGLLRSKSCSECIDAEVVRESEMEQEKVVELEKHFEAKLGRGTLGREEEWDLSTLPSKARQAKWKDLESSITLGPTSLLKVPDFSIRGSGRSPGSCIRFSPNARPELTGGSIGIWKPVLAVLHVLQHHESCAVVLTLAEAAAVRQAMCHGLLYARSVRLELRMRSSVVPSERVDGAVLATSGAGCNAEERLVIAQQQSLLRFFQGDVWLGEDEVSFLQDFSGGNSAVWLRAWNACEAWRRTGGVQRWAVTPVGRVIGDKDCIVQLEEEQAFQSAALKLVAEVGGIVSATGLYNWLCSRCGGAEVADFDKVFACVEDAGWQTLVRRFRDERGQVSLRPLAEEVSARAAGAAADTGAGSRVLASCATKELLGGADFIAAAREAEAIVVAGEEMKTAATEPGPTDV